MYKLIFSIGILLSSSVLFVNKTEAACLHAILVGDSFSQNIDIESDIDHMKREVKKIATLTDLDLNALVFEGRQVRIENVLDQIASLNIQPDDIVILYFIQHGSRTHDKKNRWPDLIFPIDKMMGNGYVDFSYINEMVKGKNPRLMLSISGSCNSYRDDIKKDNDDEEDDDEDDSYVDKENMYSIPNPPYEQILLNKSEVKYNKYTTDKLIINNYRKLFLDQKGSIIISAASPGEESVIQAFTGSILLVEFLKEISYNSGDWQKILEGTVENTIVYQKEQMLLTRIPWKFPLFTPQYEINLH